MKPLLGLTLAILLAACGGGNDHGSVDSLRDARGQWVLVNYWAQWCKPCIEEIPELNHFGQQRSDVTVLGVNFEGAKGEDLAQQLDALGVEFPTIDDPSAELGIARPAVLPTTLLVNMEGVYSGSLVGPQTAETLAQAIAEAAEQEKKGRP